MIARATVVRGVIAALIAAGACVQGLPRRVTGSDVTLPEPNDRRVARAIASRCPEADSTDTSQPPTSRCGGSTRSDTVRSTGDPLTPPSPKTP